MFRSIFRLRRGTDDYPGLFGYGVAGTLLPSSV
jgi:hypothetical protein